ncbi:3-hydroxyacyl-ACP dehydratase FabZ family protein [Stigmatella aurantiaca]|uniref:Coronafacic acid dehydratase (CFA-dehydratase) n=1 Tax=Stigmatella aurantiaca (strain DW4/3-1) TaxID=378806 RepID=E3FMG9_STIAD|nr:3-hydroxyacyl-ACP dehydratase FabZ family protein [Stigmatella aurantiaca]ADO70562.1 Coronafacic acid dehydratase (CFA-dehydratase) [Stigmatella aurantiaca DW4/3-1]
MSEAERPPKALGFTALRQWLRHRHPMIYLDRIVDHEPGKFLDALISVSGNLDFIAGHFPERAIYPGSHLIQAFAQSGIILYQMSTSMLAEDELTLIGSVEARFLKVVVPGDQILLRVQAGRLASGLFHFTGKALVGSNRVAAFRASLVRSKISELGAPLW